MTSLVVFVSWCCLTERFDRFALVMSRLTGEQPRSGPLPKALAMALVALIGVFACVHGILTALLVLVLCGIAWVDHRTAMIPDTLQWCGILLVFAAMNQSVPIMLIHIGAAAVFVALLLVTGLIYTRTTGRPAMGTGDIKMIGWLFLAGGQSLMLWLAIGGAVVAGIHIIRSAQETKNGLKEDSFPFGPYLSAITILYLGVYGVA